MANPWAPRPETLASLATVKVLAGLAVAVPLGWMLSVVIRRLRDRDATGAAAAEAYAAIQDSSRRRE